jgi:3-methyladenine DNA glycosylase AlkD
MTTSVDAAPLLTEINTRLAALPRATVPQARAVRREFTARLKAAPPREVVALALQLLPGPSFKHRLVAYELVHYHRVALASLTAADLASLGQWLVSWYDVDTFAPYLSGPAWRVGQVPDALIAGWARSPDRWWRRAAVVSTIALNNQARGGQGDTPRTLAVCTLVVADRDDMVVKALSWALRELAKRDPAAVGAFVAQHDPVLAARVKREVANKLRTGLKNPKP